MVEDVILFAVVGFVAQMIDGAIGMAYGLFTTSVLLSLGVLPATASASVHAAEVFTTGTSGLAHWYLALPWQYLTFFRGISRSCANSLRFQRC